MNDIQPFYGLRFDEAVVGPLGDVVCPPYDVISSDEQVALHDRSHYNVVRLELGFETPDDTPADNRYTRAAGVLRRWLAEGALRAEQGPALYLYEQRFPFEGRTLVRRGLLCRLRLAPWDEGVVLPHEETMAKPKEDRLKLMRATACNLSPLLLMFDDRTGMVQRLMEEVAQGEARAVADTGDGQLHRLWVVSGRPQGNLAAALQKPQLYMADGHHRYETALAYRDEMRSEAASRHPSPRGAGEDTSPAQEGVLEMESPPYDFAMVLLVDARDPGLVVLPTHRVVRAADPDLLAELDARLPDIFEVERVAHQGDDPASVAQALLQRMREKGQKEPALGLYGQGLGALVLCLRKPVSRSRARPLLDVDVLHDLLLAPLMGIGSEQLAAGNGITYTRDATEAVALVQSGEAQAALLLNPTRVDQVLETARASGKMPQKSTYFYPKPITGLVMNRLE